MAETAGAAIDELVPDILITSDLVQEISAIADFDHTVQSTASSSEELAASAQQLSDQAEPRSPKRVDRYRSG